MARSGQAPALIAPATPEMAPVAAHLLYLTMRPLAEYWMGVDDTQAAQAILLRLFSAKGNLFSHQFAHCAQIRDTTVGLLLAYPARGMKALEVGTLLRYIRAAGLRTAARMVWRSFPLQSIAEAGEDEYFLAHLAVLPAYEGRGIGRLLLQRSEECAREAGARRLTLTVDADNSRAVSLYTRAGMNVVSTMEFPSLRKRFGYHGYHVMEKALN